MIKIDDKIVLGLMCGTLEERIDFLSNAEVFASLDIETIKEIYERKLDVSTKSNNQDTSTEVITLLQVLAYNRKKSKYNDEIADFVFDKLFERIIADDIWY